MSVYSAEISAVKTVFCDFNFLVDHQGSEIVFDSVGWNSISGFQ